MLHNAICSLNTQAEQMCPRDQIVAFRFPSAWERFSWERLTTKQMSFRQSWFYRLSYRSFGEERRLKYSNTGYLPAQERTGNSQIPRSELQVSHLKLLYHSHSISLWAQKSEISFTSSSKRIICWLLCSLHHAGYTTLLKQLPSWTPHSTPQTLLTTDQSYRAWKPIAVF